ncbi:MAG: nucleoside hydrolase [Ardenticatenaceae bacterium]|nr:nucleoside hydrolase [Anaerolineales bacterium]MCB8937351.1 nucleoside hydrolase [Ardenticatenaceae bacterium]MCB8975455.1 nucleoside hydrolase [Ardenticatenaceae bacterium]
MNFPKISNATRLERLQPTKGKVRMVIDTDTYNEIDDQFAIVYALLSPEQMAVEALYAAPFFNHRASSPGDGMEKSYDEILRLLERLNLSAENLAYRGSNGFLADYDHPYDSEAVRDLIDRAMNATEPLYVVAIGALTNIASAILIEPKIIEKIIVVWLGGNALHWPNTVEFNLSGDVLAARLVLDCGVPLVLIPCQGVTTHLISTVSEIELYVQGKGAIGDYLAETFKGYSDDHFAWSKEIWDVVAIAYLINADWLPSHIVSSPIISQRTAVSTVNKKPDDWLTHDLTWSFDHSRHLIRCAYHVQRDPIFRDLFIKLDKWANRA